MEYCDWNPSNCEKQLKDTIDELKKERETLRNDKAEKFMLFLDFKERMIVMMRRVILNQMMRKGKKRELFRKKKQEERNMNNKCEKCDFMGKISAGLKTHIRKKH